METLSKDLSNKKQAATYLLSIDPETERLQVEIHNRIFSR